jgi:hypothetical protein
MTTRHLVHTFLFGPLVETNNRTTTRIQLEADDDDAAYAFACALAFARVLAAYFSWLGMDDGWHCSTLA